MSNGDRRYDHIDERTRLVMKEISESTAENTVTTLLLRLGLDPNDPIAAQRDFAAMRELADLVQDDEWRKDQLHLRRWRRTMDQLESKGFMALVGFGVLGSLALALVWIKTKFGA